MLSCFALASHAGVFRGARISSLVGREEIRAPLKTPAWEASFALALYASLLKKKGFLSFCQNQGGGGGGCRYFM